MRGMMNSLSSPEVVTALVLLLCTAGAAGLLVFAAALFHVHRTTPVTPTPNEDSAEWESYRTTR